MRIIFLVLSHFNIFLYYKCKFSFIRRIADIADLGVSRTHCPLSLSSLDLSGNQLRSLNTGSLESFVQLKSLDLSTNIISQVNLFLNPPPSPPLKKKEFKLLEVLYQYFYGSHLFCKYPLLAVKMLYFNNFEKGQIIDQSIFQILKL